VAVPKASGSAGLSCQTDAMFIPFGHELRFSTVERATNLDI